MSVVDNVARLVRHGYEQGGVGGVLAVSRYYAARARGAIRGPGRTCPVCGWTGREFRPLVLVEERYVRPGAVCPGCGAQERQRAFVPALRTILDAELGERRVDVLEVSPDPPVTRVLRGFAREYRASNYTNPAPGELQIDLQDIDLPDASLDLIAMSYVLCCVPDDLRAAASCWRVLRPGGMVVACEAFAPGAAHDEWGARGHGGGWRRYGLGDVAERFAPFETRVVDASGSILPAERARRGVSDHEYVIVLRKTAAHAA